MRYIYHRYTTFYIIHLIRITIAEPYFKTHNITTFIRCSRYYKIKTLYEQMLREDKADTYKQQKWHTYVQMLVDDVGFNEIFSIEANIKGIC